MPFVKSEVALKELGPEKWELLEPIEYQGRKEKFYVHTGFKTDLASVPRIFTWLVPRYGKYTKAAIVHDFLCETKPVNRADADGLFRRMMRELNVPFLLRWMMWAAVRAGSGLQAATFRDVMAWLLVTIPSVIFLLAPAVIVGVWLIVFWLLESVFFLLLKPFSHKQVNKPKIFIGRQ
ncbi:MAG TPA: DUF1353 domain-containing protein [Candidatus Saccharimonadales bacterium]|nr:DUF1353 domain-containing protein [Candidatus Saccharimonadales bacterium]